MGDGNSIRIWADRWLPSPTSYCIQSPVRVLDHEANVSALMDAETQWWNIPLSQEVFIPEEASSICKVAICPSKQKDQLMWVGTKNGEFLVRSVYHLAKELEDGSRGSCSKDESLIKSGVQYGKLDAQ